MQRPETILVKRYMLQAIDDHPGLLIDQEDVAVATHQFDDQFHLALVAEFIEIPERENDDPVVAQLFDVFDVGTLQIFAQHHTEIGR